jgi:hypothetical protein
VIEGVALKSRRVPECCAHPNQHSPPRVALVCVRGRTRPASGEPLRRDGNGGGRDAALGSEGQRRSAQRPPGLFGRGPACCDPGEQVLPAKVADRRLGSRRSERRTASCDRRCAIAGRQPSRGGEGRSSSRPQPRALAPRANAAFCPECVPECVALSIRASASSGRRRPCRRARRA